jgi:predicted DNA-binding transcriptional regulator AlpA
MTRTAYSVPEWCKLNGFSRAHFYNLDKIGKAPRSFCAGKRRLISVEADIEWRREREAEEAAKRSAQAEAAA